uniref:RagB/SusD family nutrient uptake outer membrane protein n=1 Tax=uncultured Draconibacterium sp. TaxID=1573823 RepID=UPI0032171D71
MHKIKNYIKSLRLLFVVTIFVTACDIEPEFYSETIPENFITSPDNVYAVLSRPFTHWRWYVGNDRWYLQELTTDEMTCPQRGSDWYNGGEYFRLHYHTWTADDRFVVNTYNGTTSGIARTLEAFEDLSVVDYESFGLTQIDKDDHVSQLRAMLAYFYMNGLDYFGGMPLYTSTEEGTKPRSTDVETFNFIEEILTDVLDKLKPKENLIPVTNQDGYISQAAGAALLARLYFNAEAYAGKDMYAECAAICKDIIDGKYGAYELEEDWIGPHDFDNGVSPELIWAVPSEYGKLQWDWYYRYFYPRNTYKYFGLDGPNGYNGFMLTPSRNPVGEIYNYKLGNTYEKFDKQDLRKKPYRYLGGGKSEGMFLIGLLENPNDPTLSAEGAKEYKGETLVIVDQVGRFSEVGSKYPSVASLPSTMADGEENSGVRLVKSPQTTIDELDLRYNPDCPVIRLAEIYYMLAECKLRASDKDEAASLINQVRKRNFENNFDPNPVTVSNLDEYRMLDEWMIEFVGEGRRRTDLIRWNKFIEDSWWDHEPTVEEYKLRFPIPNTAIAANPKMEQNPGY